MTYRIEERHHYSTYYFANVVSNVLRDPFPYLRNLEGFCGDLNTQYFLKPFPRWSALHQFITFISEDLFFEEDLQGEDAYSKTGTLWMEHALNHHGIPFQSFADWAKETNNNAGNLDLLHDWYCDMAVSEPFGRLLEAIARDVFATLFSNRGVLLDLNELIAGYIVNATIDDEEILRYATQDNRARRTSIPEWASRAVFYRDRGRCTACQRDLTGLLSSQFERHIDHIVPLARGGINDVTNLQLLCSACNIEKGANPSSTSNRYEPWYDDRAG